MKKKFFIPAVITALMGVGGYFGHTAATPETESDLLLANAETLADDTEGPVKVVCDGGTAECARVTTTPGTVHIFFKPDEKKPL